MANKTKENDLSTFLTDFADSLRKLYPTDNNKDENGNWKYEKIYPIGDKTHEGFAELIALEKYKNLESKNIRAVDDEGNEITIFGVKGDYPEKPIITSGAEAGTITATAHDKSTTVNLHDLDPNFVSTNIAYGTTILGVPGAYLGDAVKTYELTIKSYGIPIKVTYLDADGFHEDEPPQIFDYDNGTSYFMGVYNCRRYAMSAVVASLDTSKKLTPPVEVQGITIEHFGLNNEVWIGELGIGNTTVEFKT